MWARTIRRLDEWLQQAARERPGHPALAAGGRELTYAELEAAASAAAHDMARAGVGPGDRMALLPGPGFPVQLHALPKLGAVAVPLDPRRPQPGGLGGRGSHGEMRLREHVVADEVHSVIHTSGTTGEAKAIELTYGNHHASAMASAEAMGVEPGDRWLCPMPLFHVGGLAILLRSAIYATTAVLHERFDTERVKAELEDGGVTIVSLVPTMLRRLREAGLGHVPGLRAVLLGGGPIPPDLLDWAASEDLPVMATYGMTEAASQIATGRPGERGARPLPGVDLRIAGDGEILVRGPMVSAGALADDGWLHTGDRGRLDGDGRLHVEGRLKEIIVSGGENISPVEVEAVLLGHPAVADAAVVGLPDPEWGESVAAFVTLRGDATADELLGHCRERLASFMVPKTVTPVEELPRNAAGKLLRAEVARSAPARVPGR